jgi:hypothetical protein
MEKYFAIYSEEQKENAGSLIYLTPSGEEVEVTYISKDKGGLATLPFKDKVFMGEVTKFIKRVSKGKMF